MPSDVRRSALLAATAAALLATGVPARAQPGTPPPAEVGVVAAHSQAAPLTRELVGRLAATRVAQVRARVAGIVLKRVYTEGTDVTAGQTLFQIDPAPLQTALHAEQAALAKARADAANAAIIARRYRELSAKKLASSQDLDTALANERTTQAAVKEAEANVEKAKLDLSYATVTAPIAGRAGRALVTEGALVGQGEATELTTIEQVDPLYVNFSQSVGELQQLQGAAPGTTKVEVLLPGGHAYPHAGTLDFSDLAVNPGTGTVSLRAVLPNPERRLLPGMFVKLRITMGVLKDAFLLPQATLGRDTKGAYVMVVGDGGKVQQRRVHVHGMTRSDWILTGDLRDGDRVIVEGLQKVQPGGMAKAVPASAKEG
jgi:membrane fusion protein (multidrug efflux system)